MAIRINHRETPRGAVIELHGWFSKEVLGDFDTLCSSIAGPLRLDLSNLAGADEDGLRALRCRVSAGARLEGVPPYIRLLLEDGD